jgi:hypothetical protein
MPVIGFLFANPADDSIRNFTVGASKLPKVAITRTRRRTRSAANARKRPGSLFHRDYLRRPRR